MAPCPLAASALPRRDDVIPLGEVSMVKTKPTCQLPNAFDRVQLGALGREKIPSESGGLLFSPTLMKKGVVIVGLIRDDNETAACAEGGAPQITKKAEEACSIKLTPYCLSIPAARVFPSQLWPLRPASRGLRRRRGVALPPGLPTQSSGPPGSLSFPPPRPSRLGKALNPGLHRARRLPAKRRHLGASQSLGDEQHPREAVPIPGLLGSTDLLLPPEEDFLRVSNNQRLHATRKTQGNHPAQLFMSLCLNQGLRRHLRFVRYINSVLLEISRVAKELRTGVFDRANQ